MTIASAVLFALAAVGGVALLALRARRDANPPLAVAVVHGLAAAAGLVLLIVAAVQQGFPTTLSISLGLFVVAALGGFVLFATHLRDKLLPLALGVVHGLAAVAGFLVLLYALATGA